ncbi:cell division ATP-binding protein FtsE [Brachybacterium huguangmaarense]
MIRFDDVTKTYARSAEPALSHVDLEFDRGDFVFLVGASGSGKSTLMRLVLKETVPSSGSVYVAGRDLARLPSSKIPVHRRGIGMVFQDFRLLPSKTAYQNIEFALAVIGTPRKQVRRLVPEMLEMVGLEDKGKRLPHELSGGEQQRVAIARAYVNRPAILLADEPTGNLDPATSEGILELLAEINEQGTTVVMATHDQGAVDRMSRRVVELVGGVVVRDEEHGTYQSDVPVSVISGAAGDAERDIDDPDADDVDPDVDHDADTEADSDTGTGFETADADADAADADDAAEAGERIAVVSRAGSFAVTPAADVLEEDLPEVPDPVEDRADTIDDAFEEDPR